MPVDPILVPFLPTPPMPDDIDFPAYRAEAESMEQGLAEQLIEPGPEGAERRVVTIPVTDGAIELAIYRPALSHELPVHIYLHGGGWVGGSALSVWNDTLARERAVRADCVVIAVNYRKAPEHKFPTPLLDCQAALEWAVEHATEIGVDPRIITIGGGSAGANLAAALVLKLRDDHGPSIALQLLEVPALDLTLSLPSHSDPDLGSRYALHRQDFEQLIPAYLGDHGDPRNPYVSPLLAPNLSGLPPAYIMSSEFDVLRDDGATYAQKLLQAGVPAVFSLQLGHTHPSSAFTKIMPAARRWRDEVIGVLQAANSGDAPFLVRGAASDITA